jgi:hypothetical protein
MRSSLRLFLFFVVDIIIVFIIIVVVFVTVPCPRVFHSRRRSHLDFVRWGEEEEMVQGV